MAFAAHVLRNYNVFDAAEPHDSPSLGRFELSRLIEFIEENIDKPITLAELAALVNVSRFHFTRLFKRSSRVTAISLVKRCRIRRAQSLTPETELTLVDVALMTGFADQATSRGASIAISAARQLPSPAKTVGAGQ